MPFQRMFLGGMPNVHALLAETFRIVKYYGQQKPFYSLVLRGL